VSHADREGKAPSAARAARRVPGAPEEACLRTVASAWSHGEVLLTVLVTERRGGEGYTSSQYGMRFTRDMLCCAVNPDVETLDWRAVCGRTARTVRRAGRARAFPDPYQMHLAMGQGAFPLVFPRATQAWNVLSRLNKVCCAPIRGKDSQAPAPALSNRPQSHAAPDNLFD
jgi:hypothetical protein